MAEPVGQESFAGATHRWRAGKIAEFVRRGWSAVRGWPCGYWLTLTLGLHAGLLAYSAAVHSPTMDEPFHLAAGVRHWRDGRFDIDRGNPPLVGGLAAVPVMLAGVETDWHRAPNSFLVGSDFLKANGSRVFWLMTLGRWALLPLSVWGGLVCFWWARELGGERAGLLSVALWSFSPQVLAFGSLVGGDMAATSLGLTAMYAFWKWMREPGWRRAFLCGLVWGLAELAKFVWLFLYLLLPLLWLCWRWHERRERPFVRTIRREFWHGLLMVLLSLDILNVGYLFLGFGRPVQDYQVGQKVLGRLRTDSEELTGLGRFVAACPVPLPSDYVRGLDEITQFVTAKPPSYLRGEYRPGGWWYFYLYGWLMKCPLGMWVIFLLSLGLSWQAIWRRNGRVVSHVGRFPLMAAGAVFLFVTLTSGVQFLRYSLPVLPLIWVWSSQVIAGAWDVSRVRHVVLVATSWSVVSSLWFFPHSLSYFNELAGGPSRGERHLIDDSLDWGQDLLFLRRWLEQHPEARPLKLAYWGWTDPRVAGIEFELPPRHSELMEMKSVPLSSVDETMEMPHPSAQPIRLTPGWYAVSIGLSHGGPWIRIHDGTGHEATLSHGDFFYFQDLLPIESAGYSIRIYYVDEKNAERIQSLLNSSHPRARP